MRHESLAPVARNEAPMTDIRYAILKSPDVHFIARTVPVGRGRKTGTNRVKLL
jgi:hypothetical protein